MEEKEIKRERERKLYFEVPNLINRIILNSALPLPIDKEHILREIEEIKKITHAECEATLAYFKELGVS